MNNEKILERFYTRFNKYNSKVLKKLGNAIKKFDGISPSDAHTIAQELKYGTDIDDLTAELSKLSGKSVKDIEKTLDSVAKENVDFAETYYKAKNKEFVEYKDNKPLQRYVTSVKNETNELFKNISKAKNVGFVLKDEQGNKTFRPIKKVYNDLVDEAVFNVTTGVSDYQSAMRNTINQLADSGIRVNEEKVAYKSGYSRRIDSAVRTNILTGIRKVNIGIQEQVGNEFGADGVEISAHSPCAEDHLPIQGKQFTKKEFDKINGSLDRPIGEYNCQHFVFSVVLGVNKPNYSRKQLRNMEYESTQIVEYEGKKYTKYEATQVQRKLETEIRKQKDRQIIAKASGNKEEIAKSQKNITTYTRKYNDFSKKAKLDTYKERLTVSGYKRVAMN